MTEREKDREKEREEKSERDNEREFRIHFNVFFVINVNYKEISCKGRRERVVERNR